MCTLKKIPLETKQAFITDLLFLTITKTRCKWSNILQSSFSACDVHYSIGSHRLKYESYFLKIWLVLFVNVPFKKFGSNHFTTEYRIISILTNQVMLSFFLSSFQQFQNENSHFSYAPFLPLAVRIYPWTNCLHSVKVLVVEHFPKGEQFTNCLKSPTLSRFFFLHSIHQK